MAVELGDVLADGRIGNGACQPPWAKAPRGSSSGPPGACITPSSVRNVSTVSFMVFSFVRESVLCDRDAGVRDQPLRQRRPRCPEIDIRSGRPRSRAARTLRQCLEAPAQRSRGVVLRPRLVTGSVYETGAAYGSLAFRPPSDKEHAVLDGFRRLERSSCRG